jgi:acetyl-CoA carboxylase biotin carboxyl carrier protein
MDIREIRQLIKLVESANIGELEIEEEGKKIRIAKQSKVNGEARVAGNPMIHTYSSPAMFPGASPVPSVNAAGPQQGESGVTPLTPASNVKEIRSPMVGTFYRSPSPDADSYVDVGQYIKTGQTLCIIEAMKLMNELESEIEGKLIKILVENAQPVEYNQPLFLIET